MYFRKIKKLFRLFRWIRYPQYIMFLLEGFFLFLSFSIDNNLFHTKISILRYFFISFLISAFKLSQLALFITILGFRIGVNYGSLKHQFNSNKLENINKKIFSITFLITYFEVIAFTLETMINNKSLILNYTILGIIFDKKQFLSMLPMIFIFFFALEMPLFIFKVSPFVLYSFVALPFLLLSSIGVQKGIITWAFLAFLLITIGINFYDKVLVNYKGIEIDDYRILEKKIKYLFIVACIYFGLLSSELIIGFKCYNLFIRSTPIPEIVNILMNGSIKIIILLYLYAILIGYEDKVYYWIIARIYSRELKPIYGNYKRVVRENKGFKILGGDYFLVEERESYLMTVILDNDVKEEVELDNVLKHSSDVIQIKNDYYVTEENKLLEEISTLSLSGGYQKLGRPFRSVFPLLVVLGLLFSVSFYFEKYHSSIDGDYVRVIIRENLSYKYSINENEKIKVKEDSFYYRGEFKNIDRETLAINKGKYWGKYYRGILEIDNFEKLSKDDKNYSQYYVRKGSSIYNAIKDNSKHAKNIN